MDSQETRCKRILSRLRNVLRTLELVWQAHPTAATVVPFLTIVAGILPAVYLSCGKRVIDGVSIWLQGDASSGRRMVALFLGIGFAVQLGQHVVDRLLFFFEQLLRLRLTHHIRGKILDHTKTLDMSFFETPAFYDKLNRAQQEAGTRPYMVLSSFLSSVRQCVTLFSYLMLLVGLSLWIAPFLLLASAPHLVVEVIFGRRRWSILFRRTPDERCMQYYQQILTSRSEAKEIRTLGFADYLMTRWRETFGRFYRQDRQLALKRCLVEIGVFTLRSAATVGFYAYVILRTIQDPLITIGSLLMYTQAMERAVFSTSVILRSVGTFYENALYIGNLFDFLKLSPRIRRPKAPLPVPTAIRRGIRFDSVSFRYPGCTQDVLRGVSFEIRAGERIAIVGENGAGKTTLIKLLARLYDPTSGQITVDGVDLKEFDPYAWYDQIGIVFQDFGRYCVTARENIGFGRVEWLGEIDRISRAAHLCGVDRCISRLPEGWDTMLGKLFEGGQDLSLGEWQKLALSRIFFRNAQVLVLDEPTAFLDPKAEYEIFAKFNEITKGKTSVLISHRFSTVRMADRIIMIEDGHLIENGTHEELMNIDNRYAKLFNRQASAYH